MQEFGHIDILVNNAGGGIFRTVMGASPRSFESDLRTNLVSVFLCIKAVAPVMQQQKQGSIINISSRESQMPSLGMGAYGAAKAGVNSITRTLAWELAPLDQGELHSAGVNPHSHQHRLPGRGEGPADRGHTHEADRERRRTSRWPPSSWPPRPRPG